MSNVFYKRMPAGVAGDVTRREHATIEPQIMNSSKPVKLYGVPVKMVNGKNIHLGTFKTDEEAYSAKLDFNKKNRVVNKYVQP